MGTSLIACAYVCTAISIAWMVARLCVAPQHTAALTRVTGAWLVLTVLMFVSPHPIIYIAMVGVTLVYMSPKSVGERIMFFCALLPAAPIYVGWAVPFPGINYLLNVNYITLLSVFLLLPIVMAPQSGPRFRVEHPAARRAFAFIMCYLGLVVLLKFRSVTMTHGVRLLVVDFLTYGVLALALWKAMREEKLVEHIMLGLFLGGVLLIFVGLMQDFKSWALYTSVANSLKLQLPNYQDIMVLREGSLRIAGTMINSIPFGMYMAMCSGIGLYYYATKQTLQFGWLLPLLLVYGAFRSGSRGAQLMTLIVFAVWAFYSKPLRSLRPIMLTAIVGFIVALFTTNLTDSILEADDHGTLEYRLDLVVNSMDVISKHPFFGTPEYEENESMERSRQGQGIIDITNTYLGVTIWYGFVGLFFFVVPLWVSLKSARKHRKYCEANGMVEEERLARVAIAIVTGFAIALLNVSPIDRIFSYYWLLVLLSTAVAVRPALVVQEPVLVGGK